MAGKPDANDVTVVCLLSLPKMSYSLVMGQFRSTNQKQIPFFLIPHLQSSGSLSSARAGQEFQQEGNDCVSLCDVGVFPLAGDRSNHLPGNG